MPKCPICKTDLLEEGYPDELGFQRYRCPNGCKFDTPLSWKVQNAVALTITFVAYLFFLFLALLLSLIIKIKKVIK